MILFAGLITGLLSAIVLTILWFSIFGAATIIHSSPIFFLVIFLVLWVGSMYSVVVGARSASAVWARGGLFGAVEWLLVGLVMVGGTFGYRMSAVERDFSSAGFGGAFLASGFIAPLWIGFLLFMVICSLTVWFVAKLSRTEFGPSPSPAATGNKPIRRPCPHCTEEILPAAKICPFCKMAVEQEMVCPQCDAFIPFEARYCPQCGKLKLLQP